MLLALTVALLAQVVRVTFPLLYDVREDVGAGAAVGWAFGAFVVAPLLLAVALRPVPPITAVRAVVVGLALARIAAQFVHPIPVWLGAAGVAAGLTALVVQLRIARDGGDGATAGIVVVVGLALDTTMLGAFETWDAVWQDGVAAAAVGTLLPAAAIAAAALPARAGSGSTTAVPEHGTADGWPMVLVGPFLLLHVLFLQNVAFGASETGMSITSATALVLLGSALGVIAAARVAGVAGVAARVAVAGLLVLSVVALALVRETVVAVAQPLGGAAAAAVLTVALAPHASAPARPARPSEVRAHLWFAVGTALFVGAAFAYQIDVDVPLPVPRGSWPVAAAALLAIGSLRPHRARPTSLAPALVPMAGAIAVAALLLDFGGEPQPATPTGTYRLLDWNIHTAVDGDGQVVLGEVADLIESQDPDIVVLQEVGRGWPIAGQADDLEWLARRLDMSYVWAPAADGQFGNAILSRYPLTLDRIVRLPYGEGPQERTAVGVTMGTDPPLFVVGAHLQHGDRPSTREEQLLSIMATWGRREAWVLAGDLNMQPDEPQTALLSCCGLASVQDLIGDPDASTARDPVHLSDRVDWIWVTPASLEVTNFAILPSGASDHLPLVADVTP